MRLRKGLQNALLLTGYAYDINTWSSAFVYRMSFDGDSLQSVYLNNTQSWQSGFDILSLPDTTGYFLFAYRWIDSVGQPILKLNNSLTIDTAVHLEGDDIVTARWLNDSVFATANSEYDTASFSGLIDLHFSKFDINLNLLFDTLIRTMDTSYTEANNSMDFITPDKIFAGGTKNYQGNFWQSTPAYYYLLGFDNNLTAQWQKIISHNDDYLNLWNIHATNDGGVLLSGTRYNYLTSGAFERDIYVIKLDSLGNFTTGINETTGVQFHDVILYPNPSHDVINISSTINFNATEITLYDAEGRKVMDKEFNKNGSFSVAELNAGIYFYEIKDAKGKTERGKIVKE